MEQGFDAIVVGAGPAGCACGYTLAKAGLQTLIVERGKFAGAKNTWGGSLFGPSLSELIPEFWKEAPVERFVTHRRTSVISGGRCLSVEYSDPEYKQPPYDGFILLRSAFDRWFADKAQQAGAVVAAGLQVDDLIRDGKQITGIKAGGDSIPASVVIACDGVNSVLARKAGLGSEIKAKNIKQGIKEVLALPREVIEQRFGISKDEGLAWEFFGSFTGGVPGGAFIYTNKESLSVGIVVNLSSLPEKKISTNDLLEAFKSHPEISKLIAGSTLVEYSGHLIPVAGVNMMPKLYGDGMLVAGDAAGLVLVTGLILEGANLAITSGVEAAKAVIKAKEKGDFSVSSLAAYEKSLKETFVLKDLNTFNKAPHFLENERVYTNYSDLACELMHKIRSSNGKPRKRLIPLVMESMKGKATLLQTAIDLMRGGRAL
jgi:electron transfer flavoprotein-quinone oxidoreductase